MKNGKEWGFFRTPNGKIAYHPRCLRCSYGCKQSWQVKCLSCPKFRKAG